MDFTTTHNLYYSRPRRSRNVHIPPEVFREYQRAIPEHFIPFGQRMFIIVMGHEVPDMKSSVVDSCNYLCREHSALIAVYTYRKSLRDLHLVDTSIDKHTDMCETSIVMAIDNNLVKNIDLYRKCRELRKYGVAGESLKALPNQGLKFVEAVVSYIENFVRNPTYSKRYYN